MLFLSLNDSINNKMNTPLKRILGPNIWKKSIHQLTLELINETKEKQRQRLLLKEEDKQVRIFEKDKIIEEFAENGIILHREIYTSTYDDSYTSMQYSLPQEDELSIKQQELMEKSKLGLKRYRTINFSYSKRGVIVGNCYDGYYYV